MIDLARIKREPTKGRIVIELLLNVPQLLLIFYGLTCIVTQHGQFPSHAGGAYSRILHLAPVNGTVAATAGWQYIGLGLFIYFSDGSPPGENRVWLWRFGRFVLRWGGLSVALYCFGAADGARNAISLNLEGMPPFLLAKIIAFIGGFVALMSILAAIFQREKVKRELIESGCQPLHIWWQPGAYWIPWGSFFGAAGFRVTYANSAGSIHRGYCIVYQSFAKNTRWGNRRVQWLTDTAVN